MDAPDSLTIITGIDFGNTSILLINCSVSLDAVPLPMAIASMPCLAQKAKTTCCDSVTLR